MLKGQLITLRPVQEADLEAFYAQHADIDNRGNYYPRSVVSKPALLKRYAENGFWGSDDGILLITLPGGEVVGEIEFFRTVHYLDELELSYRIFSPEQRGKGFTSEAVKLLVRYLFETRRFNRIRLVIHPDNAASRRLAEKCGFRHEGTARGAWYHQGKHHDVEIYAILHGDVIGR